MSEIPSPKNPFELMINTITSLYFSKQFLQTFYFLLPMLKKENAVETFLLPNGEQHTLMTLFCAKGTLSQLYAKEVFLALLDLGCQWNQEVQGEKTAMSFLVSGSNDRNLDLITWCVSKGANPQKGHLLVYASNGITKSEYDERVVIQKHHGFLVSNGMTPLADPELIHPPFENNKVFNYLISMGALVDDIEPTTGMTPLIAACSEDNLYKVRCLLNHSPMTSLYRKNKNGMSAFDWGGLYRWKYDEIDNFVMHNIVEMNDQDTNIEYPLRDLLCLYERDQHLFWKQVMDEVVKTSLLKEVQVRDLLEIVSMV